MALKIRLARGGAKKKPFYRIVVAQSTAPRDGSFVEKIGTYDPMLKDENAQKVVLNAERAQYWLSVGAQPTQRVALFLANAKLVPAPERRPTPKKSAPRKKAVERAKEKAAQAEASA